jgi:hypothetical protein
MTAGQLAVVLAAVLSCVGFAALVVVLVRVLDTLSGLREEMRRLRDETVPLMVDLRASVGEAKASVAEARDDLERFDRVLGSAEVISDAVAGSSRLIRGALATPVIKTVALASGTAIGARRLRRSHERDGKGSRRAS